MFVILVLQIASNYRHRQVRNAVTFVTGLVTVSVLTKEAEAKEILT
jgi:hypothetical protein